MRIVILGAGQVGGTLARSLAREDNDITLVDLDEDRLRELQHRLDIRTVLGSAAHPNILINAGIEQADMLIAVTNSDEINMMGCQIAYSLFRTPTKIARIRSRDYYDYPQLFCNDHVPVDVCISPEKLVTEHIENLIDYPGVTQLLEFADGKLLLATIKPQPGGVMVGKTIQQLYDHLAPIEARVVAIFRDKTAIAPEDNCEIVIGDDVLFIASPHAIQQLLIALGRYTHPNRRIMIAGGGHIGSKLAETLENKYRIKVIDRNLSRASDLASQLHKGTVLQGDIADRDLLVSENIEFTDVFCAVTNDDEANIMSCLQAKRLGARHVIALVNRNAYVDLIEDSVIDHAISPQLITIGSILTKLRRGNMVKVYRLQNDEAEAIELITHGDELTSQVVGRQLSQIELPPSSFIAAVMREDKLLMPEPDLQLESGDHVIILLLKRRYVRQIESLFQVNLTFTS
ncbi:Trk system potassium transporter TrkA [Legionella jordanis]|uniref:Trk system potassium uptake protein TrkA n=1 Tax=Legionella jordanis TaxID=456 RepID=A0A0W0VBV5_9GAMM|nr:Trk system potassium transporter TrkA [Legionella jordanis]KTD17600.1 Trk system potassium uptake protein TrkA [Legionella jordanis]RMX00883.1 Trk system potassium transporter TrkA [Legionella jordanis]RMX17905.1 Trk system potassium transporter TrkA [Legionella jordanis]VEH11478.1 Trk system potassium uptake protein trkA [Legionella jordanis]HAT8714905.1 Trk system potassium transporter TrkA [Legionella jordanis]